MKDKIIDYLQNELSPAERKAFEKVLATDPELRTELAFQKDLMDKLRAAQIRKEVEAKSDAWEAGAAALRNQHKGVQLRVISGGLALAASLLFVVFNIKDWGNKDKEIVVIPQSAPSAPKTPLPKSEIPIPPSEIAVMVDSIMQNKVLNTPPIAATEEKGASSPASKPKSTPTKPFKKKQSSIPLPVESQVPNVPPPIPSSIATTEPKSEGGFLAGEGNSDTAAQNAPPAPTMTALDSTLRIPVKSLVSEADLLQRFEIATQLKGNMDLKNLVNQYFNATKQAEKIRLPDVDSIDIRLKATRWLLKAMYNFETVGNTDAVLSCLSKIPEPFFKQEKLLYEQLVDIPTHRNRLKAILKPFSNEPLNIHYEKSLQLAPYFK